MERKVGSTFTYKDMEESLIVKLRVVKNDSCIYHCFGCFFWDKLYPCDGKKSLGPCSSLYRTDKTNIVFQEVKK